MKIKDLIEELYKEINRGDEEIFVEFDGWVYEFNLGIDENGKSLICDLKPYQS